ncbi:MULTISPECIES: RES family NAD+ phosphorylase [Bradyrhizobium]|uniref:RES domain-containing protein n=1 Tax=Bradyrhizobium japonicum TaxID=375 RepID=A0ABV2S7U1_BRAJP|nr:RES family NAD+ phosphorylase [Bradyrhizobium sp. CCBAU 15544]
MTARGPTATFAKSRLDLHTVPAGVRFGRIYLSRYPHPLGYGKSPSRFSDPRRRIAANRFGVLYLGDTLKVCFLEAVLRDRRDGADGSLLLSEDELQDRHYATIEIASPLTMVDLRGDRAIRMGVPTDVARALRQTLARHWSLAWHEHPSGPDGIVSPSRLNGQTNLAIFDRAVPKLKAIGVQPLIGVAGLATVLDDLMVELAP